MVVITADDMSEVPVLRGRPELTIDEIDEGDEDTKPLFVGENADPASNIYNVDDEDDRASVSSWRLEGEDKDQLRLTGTVGRTLVFKDLKQPNYENPADADGDNVYKVTVVAFDNDGVRGEFDVCIAVMNIDEVGKITLRDKDGVELVQPHADGPITADLTDPDGGVTGVTWQWERSQVNPPTPTNDLADIAAEDGGTSKTYTPTNDDTSYWLKVTATYMDAKNDATTDPPDADPRMADATAMHAVLEVEDQKRPPAFSEETAIRMVAENAPSTTFVGNPLAPASDPDDPKGVGLMYTLEDSDNDSEDTAFFELFMVDVVNPDDPNDIEQRATTQIRVKLHDMAHDLDHEAKGRNGIYEVVLKVSDGSPDTDDATITVSITVTDRNEAPTMPMEAEDGAVTTPDANSAPVFPDTETGMRSVAENTATGMPIGDPVMATDADDDTLTYTLGGDDMASFTIDMATGQLMVGADSLDFEAPADADTDNAYEVTVTASDGTDEAMVAVTITVTDVENEGAISYDTDGDGMISKDEAIGAFNDYFAGTITKDEAIAVFNLYFAGAG